MSSVSSQVATKLSKRGRAGEGRPPSGIRAAADKLGIDKDDAHRAVKVASLSPAAKEAAKKHGQDDNRSVLLAAAKHKEPEKQVAELERIATARHETAGTTINPMGSDDIRVKYYLHVGAFLRGALPVSYREWVDDELWELVKVYIKDDLLKRVIERMPPEDRRGTIERAEAHFASDFMPRFIDEALDYYGLRTKADDVDPLA